MSTTTPPAIEILGQGIGQPATHLFLITPNDDNELPYVARGIRCGGAGDLAVQTYALETVTIASVRAGEILPVMARKVYATNTTATDIMGLA